ncbi:MAG: T9SS type A sorting domain-containing protein, partial [Bacteroidota bacterium]
DLYAGGGFTVAGGINANSVAKWNGTQWSALGSGMVGEVYTLAVNGANLYAGGWFTNAGGVNANRIARWNGTYWFPLGSGMNSFVYSLSASGSDLYAGGYFTTAGGVTANCIARWDGTEWSPLGSGMNESVYAVAAMGNSSYAGGMFTTAGSKQSMYIGRWFRVSTSVKEEPEFLVQVRLVQNYPNPFNPTTTIEYYLATSSNVVLQVYNVLGQEVTTLVNTKEQVGSHRVVFDGKGLSAGVYFCRLQTEGRTVTRKLLLLR